MQADQKVLGQSGLLRLSKACLSKRGGVSSSSSDSDTDESEEECKGELFGPSGRVVMLECLQVERGMIGFRTNIALG